MEYNYRVLSSLPNTAFCLNSARTALVDLTGRSTVATQQPRTNLLTNPSGETGYGWTSNNGSSWTVSDDTTVKRSGTKSKKSVPVTAGVSTSILSMYNIGGGIFPVTPGRVYTISAYFAHNTSVNCNSAVTYNFLDAGGASIGATVSGPNILHSGGSTFNARASVTTSPAPANAVNIRIGATTTRSSGNSVAGDAAWIDDAMMEEGYSLGTYFDGRTAGASWTGAVDASTSTLTDSPTSTYAILANGSMSYLIGPQNKFGYTTNVFQRGQERSPFSLESWFLPSYNTTGRMSILSHNGVWDGLWYDGDKIHFTVEFATLGTLDVFYETADHPDAMHVVGTYTNGKIQLYVDGELRASADVSDAQIADGFKSRANYTLYSGTIDWVANNPSAVQDGVATYGRALTDAEIYMHFKSGRSVVAAKNVVGTFGGNMFDGTNHSKAYQQVWTDNWTDNATFTDIKINDGTLSPDVDFTTGLSRAATWTGYLPVAPNVATTLYGVRIDWDADGSYTVQASLNNGATWINVTNGQNIVGTYNWTPALDTSLLVKITFTGGIADDPAEFRRVRLTAFDSQYVIGTDNSRVIGLTGTGAVTNVDPNEPIEANFNAGFNITTSNWYIGVDTGLDPKPVRSLEFWVKAPDITGVTGRYVFDSRVSGGTEYLWASGTNVFGYISGQLYVNGQAYASSVYQMLPGVWYHIIYVFASDVTTQIDSNAVGPKNYGLIATYPTALTAQNAADMYSMYTGAANRRLATDSNPVTEGATPFKLYAYDWSISPTG